MQHGYFIGLGSNINPTQNMPAALERLLDLFGSLEVSSVAETAPVGPMKGTFLNAVIYFSADIAPAELKAQLCEIEVALGRDRTDPERSLKDRPIDLDVLCTIPGHRRDVFAGELAAESYYRAQMVGLLRAIGFSCPASAGPIERVAVLSVAGREIGLEPARVQIPRRRSPQRVRRSALVTGAAVRLGRAIATGLASCGYDIVLHYNSSHAAAELAAREIEAYGVRCDLFQQNLSRIDEIPQFLQKVANANPSLELLVNSASAYDKAKIAETTPEMLDAQWTVNFKAPFFLTKAFAEAVEQGAIINVLDNKIAFNQYQYAAYLTAKKALAELTKMAALEYAPRIRVNGVAPGVVLPAADRGPSYLEWRRQAIPTGQLGNPEQVVAAVSMLASNAFMTGQIIFVDGGESANLVGRNLESFSVGDASSRADEVPVGGQELRGEAA